MVGIVEMNGLPLLSDGTEAFYPEFYNNLKSHFRLAKIGCGRACHAEGWMEAVLYVELYCLDHSV